MSVIIAVLIVAALAGYGLLTALGFAPVKPLTQFRGDRAAPPRRFHDDVDRVLAAYAGAAGAVPGMRLAERNGRALLIDSRPTARILAGNFGVALRVTAVPAETGTDVRVEAQNKTVGRPSHATLVELERALRMAAKARGLIEVV